MTSPQIRVDNRQIISYFSYISNGFYIKRAGALQVVISSSINCSVLAIHSVQTQNRAFKFLLTQRWQETSADRSPTTVLYYYGHQEAEGTGTSGHHQELQSAHLLQPHPSQERTNQNHPHERLALQSGEAGVLQLLNVT